MIGALVAGITGSGGASLSSYESIATATGTGSSGTITFSSIPATFKHLQIRGIARTSAAGIGVDDFAITLNNITTSSYAYHLLQGNGSTASAGGAASQTSGAIYKATTGAAATANIMGASIIDVLDYGSTTKNKTVKVFSGTDQNSTAGTGFSIISSSLFISTAAVTSIELKTFSGNWTTATTFALYGIRESA